MTKLDDVDSGEKGKEEVCQEEKEEILTEDQKRLRDIISQALDSQMKDLKVSFKINGLALSMIYFHM